MAAGEDDGPATPAAPAQETSITAESITALIQADLEPSYLSVQDTSGGCGVAFDVVVVSDKFVGLTLVKRGKRLNEPLGAKLPLIHAWSPKCYTPEDWKKRKGQV